MVKMNLGKAKGVLAQCAHNLPTGASFDVDAFEVPIV